MSLLDAALQQMERAPLGTLADAWQPWPLLRFERHLPANEDHLQLMASAVAQPSSDDPKIILISLKMWRDKYLTCERTGAPPHHLERYQTIVEALRSKVLLLFRRQNYVNWAQSSRVSRNWGRAPQG
jgi:hypothetical protein